MKAWTRLLSAFIILAGLYISYTYLVRLPNLRSELHKYGFTVPDGYAFAHTKEKESHTWRQQRSKTISGGSAATTSLFIETGVAFPTQEATSLPMERSAALATQKVTSTAVQANSLSSPLPDRMVVIGKTDTEDTSWVKQLEPSWDNAVYWVTNRSQPLHTSMNKGKEANVYLTYIVEYYDRLPTTIAFVHAHEKGYPQAWHTDAVDYSNVNSLRSLQVDHVQRNGYANLRCIAIPGCPEEIMPFREPYEEDRTAEHAFPEAWNYIFENDDVPNVVATPCCAQFAVSRDRVLKRPLRFYVRALKWLHETPLNDDTSGRVFEYLWHIIFGQEAVYCPAQDQCYRDVYNRAI